MKSNTNAIRKQIRKEILRFCENVNYRKRPQPVKYPYVIFELKVMQVTDGKAQCRLEINCVSNNAAEVEDIADGIWDIFDEYSHLDASTAFETYAMQRDIVEEEDKEIERRRLIFELNYHKREE
ncbi:MAG: hypothetical protein SOW80_11585 [Anaerovoracaceae bacterium]|nr:hypothetical protein [Anaerovoracaceae bacterium]